MLTIALLAQLTIALLAQKALASHLGSTGDKKRNYALLRGKILESSACMPVIGVVTMVATAANSLGIVEKSLILHQT